MKGPNWHGTGGTHVHMTNTRITDPEILESRYPIILNKFCLRDDQSGGRGLDIFNCIYSTPSHGRLFVSRHVQRR